MKVGSVAVVGDFTGESERVGKEMDESFLGIDSMTLERAEQSACEEAAVMKRRWRGCDQRIKEVDALRCRA